MRTHVERNLFPMYKRRSSIQVGTNPVESTSGHSERVVKLADKRFMVDTVESCRLVKSDDKNGRLAIVETGEDVVSDFEQCRLGRLEPSAR